MKENKVLPLLGIPNEEEEKFTAFLLHGIATYVGNYETDRRTLISAISKISQIVFCEQTPFNVKQQCAEINLFCDHLKSYAMRDAVKE